MQKINYPLSLVATQEYKDWAVYTVECRAIPSMIDGLKPVQRFYLYSSIKNSKNDFKKVSAVAGVISDYGYNHGEASAQGAGQLMAAEWNNHLRIIQSRGNFGSRLVPDPAAPRYTYTKIHDNFYKYFKDNDLAPEHPDVEHSPPMYYLPILPMVLINGASGIATGFSVNILPRSTKEVIKAVNKVLEGKKLKPNSIKPSFPACGNKFEWNKTTESWIEKAPYKRMSKTKVIVEDVLYSYSRKTYIEKVLNPLEDSGKIVKYEDLCSKDGFKFEITLKRGVECTDEYLEKILKLNKSHTENINVIDRNGALDDTFNYIEEIVERFIEERKVYLDARINKNIKEYSESFRYSYVIIQYIEGVLDEKIKFEKGKKQDKVVKEIFEHTDAKEEDINKLLNMSMSSLTAEKVKKLKDDLKELKKQVTFWKKTSPDEQYLSDIESLKE